MSDKSKNLGAITPLAPPAKTNVRVPSALRGRVLDFGIPYEEAVAKYGLWEMEAVRPCSFFHQHLDPGDRCKLAGNIAAEAVNFGDLIFVDTRLDDEARLLAEAARLSVPLAAKNNPAFQSSAPAVKRLA